jgi:hypothetical protein
MDNITVEELKANIHEILNCGRVIYTDHTKKRMVERNYCFGDIRHILQNGTIKTFNEKKTEQYVCEIHGKDLEGDEGAVIVLIIKNVKLIIKTVLGGV